MINEMKSNSPFFFLDGLFLIIFFWRIFNKYKKFKQKPKFSSSVQISLRFPSQDIWGEAQFEIQLFISNKQFDMKGETTSKLWKCQTIMERVRTVPEYQYIKSISNHWTLQHSGSHIVWTIAFRFVHDENL